MTDEHPTVVLVADDDEDDRLLTAEAWAEARSQGELVFVEDGRALLEYLDRCRPGDGESTPRFPSLLLLDLNMPRVDGLTALRAIKQDPGWRSIPVVVLTTSRASSDIRACYQLGANSFITKPMTYRELVGIISTLGSYWLGVVSLPAEVS